MDIRTLENIGLTEGEIKTYIALLKLGSSSIGPIAKEGQVSSSKIYYILDKLEKKGFASQIEKNGVMHFQVVEPSKIKDYIKQREDELKALEKDFDNFLPELEEYYQNSSNIQNVKVYQGLKGLKAAHEHIYLKLGRGDGYYYLGIPAYQPEEQHRYWEKDHERRAKAGLQGKLLFNQDTDRAILQNRNSYRFSDARYMPTSIKTPTYFLIYDDTVLITMPLKDPIAIEIISKETASSFKAYFEEFWKRTTPFK